MALFNGGDVTGTPGSDTLLGLFGSDNILSGGDGNDLIIGDFGNYLSGTFSNTFGTAADLEAFPTTFFSEENNPIGNGTVPHVMLHHTATGGLIFLSVTVGAGNELTVDTDFSTYDTIVQILDSAGNVVATNNDSAGDPGSINSTDSYVTYTPTTTGTYFIVLGEYDAGIIDGVGNITAGGQAILNISIEGHATNGLNFAPPGNDTLNGGNGDDSLYGMDGDDTLIGGNGDDIMDGGNGDDRLLGQRGEDTLTGGRGDDHLSGGDDNDVLDGGRGNDVLIGGNGDDALDGGVGADRVIGGTGNDTLKGGGGDDRVFGQDGDDFVSGGVGNDRLFGDAGADRLFGSTGEDFLSGGADNDLLSGGADDDRLIGGDGNDILAGGTGADRFVFDWASIGTARDVVTDFEVGVDQLEIAGGVTFADLTFTASSNGLHTTVSYNGHSIYVKNVTVAEMDADQFVLIQAPSMGEDAILGTEDLIAEDKSQPDGLFDLGFDAFDASEDAFANAFNDVGTFGVASYDNSSVGSLDYNADNSAYMSDFYDAL